MKTNIPKLAAIIAGAVLSFCAHTPPPCEDAPRPPAVPAANEWLWLAPFVNNCGIDAVAPWPRNPLERSILMRRFDDIARRLLTEFRRCEKTGDYLMVDDSGLATMTVTVTLGAPAIHAADSIIIPLGLRVNSKASGKTHALNFTLSAALPEDKEIAPFHYAGSLLTEIESLFPYRPIVRVFYQYDE